MDPSIAILSVPTALPTQPGTWDSVGSGAASLADTPFSGLMREALGEVNLLEEQANAAVKGFMVGTGVDVHQAVIATQKVEMAFELALSVRNKAVQAYQSVMGIQF